MKQTWSLKYYAEFETCFHRSLQFLKLKFHFLSMSVSS